MEEIAKRLIATLLLGSYSLSSFANPPNEQPASAVKTENVANWQGPIAAYRNSFQSEQADILKKIAEKNMQANQFLLAAQALEKTAKVKGNDAPLYYEASRTYALAGNTQDALAMIKAALTLDPNNIVYLKTYATLANWTGDFGLAYNVNQKILKQNPNDKDAILAIAAYNAGNKANYKVVQTLYQQYLSKNPNDKEMNLGYIRSTLWNDDYANGQKLLDAYQSKFGTDDNYLIEKARLLAFTNQPKEALTLAEPLLKKYPDNQDLLKIKNYTTNKINTSPPITLTTDSKTAAPPTETKPANNVPPLNPLLVSAREETHQKQYQKASEIYQKYLKENPKDNTVFLEYIRMESISGDYNAASKNLNSYEKKFLADDGYLTEKARLLALTNKSKEALVLLDALLKKQPNNASLKQIQDYAVAHPEPKNNLAGKTTPLKNLPPLPSAQAFERTATLSGNAQLYLKASQAYSAANKPEDAFKMIECAIQLDPQNLQYLKNRAEIANWLKKPAIVEDSYQKMLAISPKDPDAMLGIARSYSAKSDLYDAILAYGDYTDLYPMNKLAWIEYAYMYSWIGNNRDAVKTLGCYCQLFGPTLEYLKAKGRILANAQRPTPALAIVRQLLPKEPHDYHLNNTKVIGLYYNNQPIEMFRSLRRLNAINPNSQETKDLNAFVTTPYRSNAALDMFRSRDTDTVDIARSIVTGQLFITPLTQLLAVAKGERLSADIPSGLAPANGGNGLDIGSAMIGMSQRINPKLMVAGTVGEAHVDSPGGHPLIPDINHRAPSIQNALIYYLTANIKPTDAILINLLESRDYYDVSAKAVSLGVKQELSQIQFDWEPWFQRYITIQASYGDYSDSNSMWYISAAPKIGAIRSDKFNLNFGAFGSWNSFAKKVFNGYYDPKLYQYFAATSDVYWKQSTNIGYSLSIAVGMQKDETFAKYEFGGDLSFKGYFGIYKDWMLVLSATASNRGRSIGTNAFTNNGSYQIYSIDATLTKRF